MRSHRHRPLPPEAHRDSPDWLTARASAPEPPSPAAGYRAVVLRWHASEGYPDDVARAIEHALDLAVMREQVTHWSRDDDSVTAWAVRVEPVLRALRPLLGPAR